MQGCKQELMLVTLSRTNGKHRVSIILIFGKEVSIRVGVFIGINAVGVIFLVMSSVS